MKYNVLLTKQNDFNLLTFSITAQKLLKFVHFKSRFEDPESGIQRSHNSKKSRKIADAIIEGDLSIPNSIIVNLNLRGTGLKLDDILSGDDLTLDIDKAIKSMEKRDINLTELFFVIDGQHRLRAFEYDDVPEFTLIVTAFVDLYIADIANLFVQINYNQKPVDKSIVYDLLGINEEIFPEYAKYHRIVSNLNNDVESPFFDKIKMLGVGPGLISQASIISAIEKYRIEKRLNNIGVKATEDELYYLIKTYFNAIRYLYSDEWEYEYTLLTKSIGLRTMIKFLPDLIEHVIEERQEISLSTIKTNLEALNENIKLSIEEGTQSIWEYFSSLGIGGEGGITNLYKLFVNVLWEVE